MVKQDRETPHPNNKGKTKLYKQMKKLELKGMQMLTKQQMKNIIGGDTYQCQLNGTNCGDPVECDTIEECTRICCNQCFGDGSPLCSNGN